MSKLLHWKNSFDFFLRSQIRWGRKYHEAGVFDLSFLLGRYQELWERYGLHAWQDKLSRKSLLLNLAKLDQLEKLQINFSNQSGPPIRLLDIGSQNFVYVVALYAFFFTRQSVQGEIVGIEIDAYRRYLSMHTRKNAADYYCSLIPGVHYMVGDVGQTHFAQPFSVITWFRPFLTPTPTIRAGLPARLCQPQQQFAHVLRYLQPGGTLILSYQSQQEAELAQDLFKQHNQLVPMPYFQWQDPGPTFAEAQYLQRIDLAPTIP